MTGFEVIQTTLVVCMHVVGLAMLLATGACCAGRPCPTASSHWTPCR